MVKTCHTGIQYPIPLSTPAWWWCFDIVLRILIDYIYACLACTSLFTRHMNFVLRIDSCDLYSHLILPCALGSWWFLLSIRTWPRTLGNWKTKEPNNLTTFSCFRFPFPLPLPFFVFSSRLWATVSYCEQQQAAASNTKLHVVSNSRQQWTKTGICEQQQLSYGELQWATAGSYSRKL